MRRNSILFSFPKWLTPPGYIPDPGCNHCFFNLSSFYLLRHYNSVSSWSFCIWVIMGFPNVAFVAVFLMAFTGLSSAVVYDVGDAAGWTKKGSVNYTAWASSRKFFAGDTIVFKYEKGEELLRVKHGDFKKCDTRNPIATFTSGKDSFLLKKPTHIYYISSVYGDCMAGQKVDIKVVSDAHSAPSPSPSSPVVPDSPSFAPAPSPSASPSLHAAGGLISVCILAFSLLFV